MTGRITIPQLEELGRVGFVARLGGIYEHSPWVAERAWGLRPFRDRGELERTMREIVDDSSRAERLSLLRRHPRLGTGRNLSGYSRSEQTAAGLQGATAIELKELGELNDTYQEKFGFPFIVAVRGMDIATIIDSCRTRINNDRDTEFTESLHQVHRIAAFRLADLVAN